MRVCGVEFVVRFPTTIATALNKNRIQAGARLFTDKEECHEKLIKDLVTAFGEFKKVTDATTGKSYRVPTRHILENGLRHEDFAWLPEWSDD